MSIHQYVYITDADTEVEYREDIFLHLPTQRIKVNLSIEDRATLKWLHLQLTPAQFQAFAKMIDRAKVALDNAYTQLGEHYLATEEDNA